MSAALRGLLERVEAATGPDRELDRDISVAVGFLHVGDRGRLYMIAPDDGGHIYGGLGDDILIPRLTEKIDAAVALVERVLPEWVWQIERQLTYEGRPPFFADISTVDNCRGRNGTETGSAYAATPPLAILAALLRALIAKDPTP